MLCSQARTCELEVVCVVQRVIQRYSRIIPEPLSTKYRSAITNPATLGPGGCRIIHFSGLLID